MNTMTHPVATQSAPPPKQKKKFPQEPADAYLKALAAAKISVDISLQGGGVLSRYVLTKIEQYSIIAASVTSGEVWINKSFLGTIRPAKD
jgi:hypothetical protein